MEIVHSRKVETIQGLIENINIDYQTRILIMDKSRLVPLWFIYFVQNFLSVNEIIIFVARMNNAQRTRPSVKPK